MPYFFLPIYTIETIIINHINIYCYFFLGLAKRVGAKILIASTSEVYGDPEVHPQPETYWGNVNPIGIYFNIKYNIKKVNQCYF